MQNSDFIKQLEDWVKKIFLESISHSGKKIKKTVTEMVKQISEKITEIDLQDLKIAWNFEEKNCKNYTFQNAVEWIKTNKPKDKIYTVGILKIIDKNSNIIELHHFFIDELNNPCLDGCLPHRLVKTKEIDSIFGEHFGEKYLIILK